MLSSFNPRKLLAGRSASFHIALSLLLLVFSASLDALRPQGKSYSILYLLPVFYASWFLRGRAEVAVHLAVLASVFLRHILTPGPFVSFNRLAGTLVGLTVIAIMWERRRHINALETANRDLEERVRVRTQSLTELNEEFKRLVDIKTQFLRNMSHEIRTPLNAIIGVTSLLRNASSDSERQALMDTLEHSTNLTLAIVNDILDLSQIEAGRLEIEILPFSLQSTVHEVALILEPEARRKGISLRCNSSSCTLADVLGDPRRVRQILMNMAGNAVKFTTEGFVEINLEILDQSPDQCRVRLVVRDSGIGIPAEVQPQLFDKFTQADPSIGRKFGGSGLGLAITKGLVELMQGGIGVESEPGKGTTVSVLLQFPIAHAPAAAPAPPQCAAKPLNPQARILVVEDNVINRHLVQRYLERLGSSPHFASNGQEAITAIQSFSYDIIFMDCHMPVMDGYETTRAIRGIEPARTPIVAMTASVLAEDRQACFAAGMDDFLPKPFTLEEFRTVLNRWVANPTTPR